MAHAFSILCGKQFMPFMSYSLLLHYHLLFLSFNWIWCLFAQKFKTDYHVSHSESIASLGLCTNDLATSSFALAAIDQLLLWVWTWSWNGSNPESWHSSISIHVLMSKSGLLHPNIGFPDIGAPKFVLDRLLVHKNPDSNQDLDKQGKLKF